MWKAKHVNFILLIELPLSQETTAASLGRQTALECTRITVRERLDFSWRKHGEGEREEPRTPDDQNIVLRALSIIFHCPGISTKKWRHSTAATRLKCARSLPSTVIKVPFSQPPHFTCSRSALPDGYIKALLSAGYLSGNSRKKPKHFKSLIILLYIYKKIIVMEARQ